MKSIVMVSHIPCGILLGLSGTLTGGLIFVVWQMVHPLMYALMNSVILGHLLQSTQIFTPLHSITTITYSPANHHCRPTTTISTTYT